jgi:hypothetical protein
VEPLASPPGEAAPEVAPPPALTAAPDRAPPPPVEPGRTPIARRWWFWTGLAGAAVAVVVMGLLLTPREPYQGNAIPGTVPVF